ncbi:hypothetical protein DFH09DRAFT_1270804 [Mycena vulgaris]|nr:hypothetical protein DFH09DRAFT_1270804 [Mycena vulgaris]
MLAGILFLTSMDSDEQPPSQAAHTHELVPREAGSPHARSDFSYLTKIDYDANLPVRSTGAIFHNAQNFVVSGGSFTSITNIAPSPTIRKDFRTIYLGDIDLLSEIRLKIKSGGMNRRSGNGSVRRMYSARVKGCKSNMTVAMYQGENVEEEWRRDITQHSHLRHPNIVQLFGTVRSPNVYATIWLDDLMPTKQLLEESVLKSPMLLIYLIGCMEANDYFETVTGIRLFDVEFTTWIRRATGRFCVELRCNPEWSDPTVNFWAPVTRATPSLLQPPQDSEIVGTMSLRNYHHICALLSDWSIGAHESLKPGTVYYCPPECDLSDVAEIASGTLDATCDGWWLSGDDGDLRQDVMEDGWTRMHSSEFEAVRLLCFWMAQGIDGAYGIQKSWLAQANYIFVHTNTTSNLKDYSVRYQFDKGAVSESIPSGYLFLCPVADLRSNTPGRFRIPQCAAYWSLDPSGLDRMNPDEAQQAGFPALELKMQVMGERWENSVYAGLRQFDAGKGFHPDSQELARHLGYPLFTLSSEIDTPYGQESESVDEPSWDPDEVLVTSENSGTTSAARHSATDFSDTGAYGQGFQNTCFNPSLFGFDLPPASNVPTFGDLSEFDSTFLQAFSSNEAAPGTGVDPPSTINYALPALPAATYDQDPPNTHLNPRSRGFERPPTLSAPTFGDLGESNFCFLDPFPSNNAALGTQFPHFALASENFSAALSRLPPSPPSTSLLWTSPVPMSSLPVGVRDQQASRKRKSHDEADSTNVAHVARARKLTKRANA